MRAGSVLRRSSASPAVGVLLNLHGARLSLPGTGRGDRPEGGGWGPFVVERVANDVKHTDQIAIDVAIPEPEDAEAVLPQASVAPSGANLTFKSRLGPCSCSNAKFESSTRIIYLLVVLTIPTFARAGAAGGSKCRNRTTSVVDGLPMEGVLAAVDLHNEVMLEADEVEHVTIPRRLPAEVVAEVTPTSEVDPELDLLRCHRLSQPPRLTAGHSTCPPRTPPTMHFPQVGKIRLEGMVPPPRAGEGWALVSTLAAGLSVNRIPPCSGLLRLRCAKC